VAESLRGTEVLQTNWKAEGEWSFHGWECGLGAVLEVENWQELLSS